MNLTCSCMLVSFMLNSKNIITKEILDALATEFPSDLFAYYDLVQFYIEKLPPEIRELKLACVISPEYSNVGRFWQTASNNRGFKYQAFISVREAEEWVMK